MLTNSGIVPKRQEKENSLMKKYTKLVLMVVAILSSLCFLIYKYRYDRLYNVLQVMEVFGTPDDPSFVPCKTPPPLMLSPAWQQVDHTVYLYSAYCDYTSMDMVVGTCPTVSVIGVAMEKPQDYKCKLWFEGSLQAMEGILSIRKDTKYESKENGVAQYTFNCESKYKTKLPYSVIIYKDVAASFPVPVIHFTGNVSKSGLQICILPDRAAQDSTSKLRESLIFHRLVEVDGARLYAGGGISTSLVDTVNKMRGEMDISIGTWNIPVLIPDTIVDSIISTDCYYQSRAKYQHYIVLSSDQVLMPHTYQSVRKTLLSTTVKQGPRQLQIRKFCSEYPSDKKSKNFPLSISILQSTLYNKQLSQDAIINIHSLVSTEDTGAVESSASLEQILTVNEYVDCDRLEKTDQTAGYQDDALRFSKDLINLFNKYS